MSDENVLVVAFDGLDYELIQEFDLDNIPQEEFGKIDNSTDVYSIKTSELFASFITGKTWEKHGVKGIDKYKNPKKRKIFSLLAPDRYVKNVRGFYRLQTILEGILDTERVRHRKEDIKVPTLFEKVNDSRAISVPSYNPSWAWMMVLAKPMQMGGTKEDAEEFCEMDHMWRKKEVDDLLGYDFPYSFSMIHLHKSDLWQHLYGFPVRDDQELRKMYKEMDEYAAEIKEKALETGYDTVIFMSDHGLPTEKQHNKNAFYSSNKELFPDEKPHITDFHDEILKRVGNH